MKQTRRRFDVCQTEARALQALRDAGIRVGAEFRIADFPTDLHLAMLRLVRKRVLAKGQLFGHARHTEEALAALTEWRLAGGKF